MSTHIVWSWGCWDTWLQEIKAMLKVSKIFYRFQGFKCYICHQRWCLWLLHKCIQTHSVLHICQSPLQEGGLPLGALHPVGSAVHHHAVWGGSFVLKCSGTCQTKKVIAGKMHSQSPILKWYGVFSNPVILTNLWQSCILHTLTEPATNVEFRI